MPRAIHIKTTAEPAELAAAPILCATRAFIERAQASGGLTLTLGGALSRADTKALFDITEWPDYDRASVLAVNKVLNEDDVLPIQFTRMVAQDARLLRAAKGRLLATRRATPLLKRVARQTSSGSCSKPRSGASIWHTSTACQLIIGHRRTSEWSFGPFRLLRTIGPNPTNSYPRARCQNRAPAALLPTFPCTQ
jgi:hypothetical protein